MTRRPPGLHSGGGSFERLTLTASRAAPEHELGLAL